MDKEAKGIAKEAKGIVREIGFEDRREVITEHFARVKGIKERNEEIVRGDEKKKCHSMKRDGDYRTVCRVGSVVKKQAMEGF